MANYILKNDNVVLRCSNWAMEVLYENLSNFYTKENLKNKKLKEFINALDQNIYGRGAIYIELLNYFDMKQDKITLEKLHELLSKVIKNVRQEKTFDPSLMKILEQFKNNIA